MNKSTTSQEHARSVRAIESHFAGRISREQEAAMRAHLPGCGDCRELYARRQLLARLDPQAVSARERIARGLGLELPENRRRSSNSPWVLRGGLPVVAVLLVSFLARWQEAPKDEIAGAQGFQARGSLANDQNGPRGWTYRIGQDGVPKLAVDEIGASDELAFAYSNPTSLPYVMIFGVDERQQVFWFHPAWSPGEPPPTSIAARPGSGPSELPEAIRHELVGKHLDVVMLFSRQPLSTSAVEDWVARSEQSRVHRPLGETRVVRQKLRVMR